MSMMRDLDSAAALHRLRRLRRRVFWGAMRRTTPLSDHWGFDRGTPVDRYYIARFLDEARSDIRGDVLEVMDRRYTERFGSAVTRSDVLDVNDRNPHATIIADLRAADAVASNAFDCFILTQTLQFVYECESAVRESHRLLRPGGVLLATVPSVSRIDPTPGVAGDFWRFTLASCRRLFSEVFGLDNVTVRAYGNVLTAVAFLMGAAAEELSPRELELEDEFFPVLIAVRAAKTA